MATSSESSCRGPHLAVSVCGLPASGKSTVGRILAELGWERVETGRVVAEVLGLADFHGLSPCDQDAFRHDSLALVRGHTPNRLAREIADRLAKLGGPVAIIGVRHVSTLQGLRQLLFPLPPRVLYVSTDPATCARRFALRDNRTPEDFFRILRIETETDQDALSKQSDAVLDNNGTLDVLPDLVDRALGSLSKRPSRSAS